MSLTLFCGGEDTSRFENVICLGILPRDTGRVFLGVELDSLAVDHEIVALDFDSTREGAMDGVILKHVGSIFSTDERVVHSNDVDVVVLDSISIDDTSDPAEAIDTHLNWCHDVSCVMVDRFVVRERERSD